MNNWTKEAVIERLHEIKEKGFIPIPEGTFRKDDGIVGQILEREFGVKENNLRLADLGVFELKGMRFKKSKPNILTLYHKKPIKGKTVPEIFNEFGYIKKSNRSNIMKKKLFTTIRGDKINNRGFRLIASSDNEIHLYHENDYLSTWDLSAAADKINKVILAFAETKGKTNTINEEFHYVRAYLLEGNKGIAQAIQNGAVVMDLCVDQPADGSKSLHDRGPHIRIPVRKLEMLFDKVEQIL